MRILRFQLTLADPMRGVFTRSANQRFRRLVALDLPLRACHNEPLHIFLYFSTYSSQLTFVIALPIKADLTIPFDCPTQPSRLTARAALDSSARWSAAEDWKRRKNGKPMGPIGGFRTFGKQKGVAAYPVRFSGIC